MRLVNKVYDIKFNRNTHCLYDYQCNKICTFFKMNISSINDKIIIGYTSNTSDNQYICTLIKDIKGTNKSNYSWKTCIFHLVSVYHTRKNSYIILVVATTAIRRGPVFKREQWHWISKCNKGPEMDSCGGARNKSYATGVLQFRQHRLID